MWSMNGKKNGSGWNPAGSGRPDDMALILLARIDTRRRNNMPFNFGWGDHFTWNNGYIYWRYTEGGANLMLSQLSTYPDNDASF